MEAYYDVVPPQYVSTYLPHPNEEPWSHEQALYGIPIDRCDRPTMHNYAQEFQNSTLTSRWIDEYRMRIHYPSLETDSYNYYVPEMILHPYQHPQRCSSPSLTGTPHSQSSSSFSDRQSTPLSPTPSLPNHSPHMDRNEIFPIGCGVRPVIYDEELEIGGPCVSMHDVQPYDDAQMDKDAFEDDQGTYYAPYIQEYHPAEIIPETSGSFEPDHPITTYVESRHEQTPNIRRRRPQGTRDTTSHGATSKVSKRSNGARRTSSQHSKSTNAKCNGHAVARPNRAFPCPFTIYGCPSTFGSKNEWKRHINTQHMHLGYWRCDLCDQAERKPNDFNRKDLFIQHVRRMHPFETKTKPAKTKTSGSKSSKNDPEEQALAAAASRCWKHIRSPPEESGCLFCEMKFHGSGTWDERLEHIGRHMETAKKDSSEIVNPQDWRDDAAIEEWLVREEIVVDSKDGLTLAEGKAA